MNIRNLKEPVMKNFRVRQMWVAVLTTILIVAGSIGLAEAKALFVANNGLDIATCGAIASPCRTISKAIENADPGDKIIVGPGRYGDLDGDGTFNPILGEEKAEVGTGCFCMIKLDKPLDIESRDGAAATVLDGGKELSAVVGIFASNVVFGRKKKGFTLTHGNLGMYINFGTSGVRVEGNLVSANSTLGFRIHGNGHVLSSNLVIADGLTGFELNDSGLVLNGNQAIANMLGFVLNGSGHQLSGNIASANSDKGFAIGGNGGHHFSSNVASANGTGFDVAFGNSNVFTGNIVHGNRSHGFLIESGAGHMLTGNSILGNGGFGIDLSSGAGATITKNNIYGNGEGLRDDSGAETNATNNFWGAATGPGDNPADGLLIGPTSNTIFTPFATKEFKIKTVTPLAEPGLIILTDPEQSEIPQAPSLTPIQFLKALQTKEGWLFRTTGNVSALRLEVMDLSGKKIYDSGLVKGQTLSWTRVNAKDQSVAKGVYLYRLTARDRDGNEIHSELRKLIIENFFE